MGGQYTSMQFRAVLTSKRFDNAAAESFFASLKAEIGTRVVHP
jgi:hypothetical protein